MSMVVLRSASTQQLQRSVLATLRQDERRKSESAPQPQFSGPLRNGRGAPVELSPEGQARVGE